MRAYRNGKTDVKIREIREIVSDFFFSCSEKNGEVSFIQPEEEEEA